MALGSGAITVLQLVQLAVLARVLDPRAFGVVAMVGVIVGFAQAYTDLGISGAIVQRRDATREQLSSLYWSTLLAGVAAFAILWLAAPLAVAVFPAPEIVPLLRAAALVLLIVPLGRQFELLLQKELQFDVLARQEVAAAVAGVAVTIGVALAGYGAWGPIVGSIVAAGVRAAQLLVVGLRTARPSLRLRAADLRGYLRFGSYQMGEHTVNFLAGRSDHLLIGGLLGPAALGFWNFAGSLTSQPSSRINPVVTRVALPVLARVQDDRELLRAGFLRLVRLLGGINAPLLVGLAATAPRLVPLAFGAAWVDAVPVVQILCLVALSRSIGNPIGTLLLASGRVDLGFRWNVAVLLATAPAVAASAMVGGLLGVAIALLALQLLFGAAAYVVLVRPLVGATGSAYADAVLRPVALAAAMGIIVLGTGTLALAALPLLVLQVGVGVLAYGAAVWLFERRTLGELRALALARA
jgi:lipopolysaccharide exporter